MRKILNKMKTMALVLVMSIAVTGCSADENKEPSGSSEPKNEQTEGKESEEKETEEKKSEIDPGSLVVTVGDDPVNYDEASYYLLSLKQFMEYQYGSDQVWGIEVQEGVTLGDQLKEAVIEQISRVKVTMKEAEKAKIELNEEEKAQAKTSADQAITAISQEDKDKYGLTDTVMQKVMEDSMVYQKYLDEVTKDVDSNVSEEEVKQVTIQHLLLKTTTDKDGKSEPMSEAAQKKVLKKAKELLAQAKKEKDFKAFAEKHTEDSNVEYTFGKGQMVKEFEEKAFSMKKGEFSEPVKTDFGYHILYCVDPNNKEAAESKKAQIIEERKMAAFEDKYAELKKNYEVKVNDTIWDQVSVIAPTPPTPSMAPESSIAPAEESPAVSETPTESPAVSEAPAQ